MAGNGWSKIKGVFWDPGQPKDDAPDDVASAAEIEATLASVRDPLAAAKAKSPGSKTVEPAEPPPPSGGPIVEGRPFSDIYAEAGVPASPYSAEKLCKVLDGLPGMDMNTRRTVVMAMSAADTWTIEHPIADAQAKIAALQSGQQQLTRAVAIEEQKAREAQAEQDAYLTEASTKIKQQIDELSALLQSEIATVTAKKNTIDTDLAGAKATAARESTRLAAEATRLGVVPSTFATPPPLPTKG